MCIRDRYKALLLEFGGSQVCAEDFQNYHADNLESKIINGFGDRIIVEPSISTERKLSISMTWTPHD